MKCADGWRNFGSSCYKSFTDRKSWKDAESVCESEGGHLASVHSQEENQFIEDISGNYTWLGGTDVDTEGQWIWVDGSPFDWNASNWGVANGEPNGKTIENCLVTWDSQPWNDAPCNPGWWARKFVCKTTGNY